MLSADDMEVLLDGWEALESAGDTRRWRNSAGDRFSLDFFGLAPDLPAPLEDLESHRGRHRDMLGDGGGLVEVDGVVIAGTRALRAIFKIPQQPTGMTYLGAVTVPFRDCSFVLEWQCPEHGVTGMRDSAVFAMLAPPFDQATGEPVGWAADPYHPAHRGGALRNRADDPEWDPKFPTHPLSRLRSYLQGLGSIRLSPRVAAAPPFEGRGERGSGP